MDINNKAKVSSLLKDYDKLGEAAKMLKENCSINLTEYDNRILDLNFVDLRQEFLAAVENKMGFIENQLKEL